MTFKTFSGKAPVARTLAQLDELCLPSQLDRLIWKFANNAVYPAGIIQSVDPSLKD